jgi:N-acetylmuramoyl-L-alanine amidase
MTDLQKFALLFFATILGGCATGPKVDKTYLADGQDSRVQFLIIHFTAENLEKSLRYLTKGPVSSHYLVTDEPTPRVLQLVDESKRAWHAGVSSWGLAGALNASSVGIEIVNLGPVRAADGSVAYQPFPEAQVEAVVKLSKEIVTRHGIKPSNVLGHSDIAPQRKEDPGPQFPWKKFADAGLIVWPDPVQVSARRAGFEASLPGAEWFQQTLAAFGYGVPRTGAWDKETLRVLSVFQMRYRPAKHDGEPDAETAAILDTLLASN